MAKKDTSGQDDLGTTVTRRSPVRATTGSGSVGALGGGGQDIGGLAAPKKPDNPFARTNATSDMGVNMRGLVSSPSRNQRAETAMPTSQSAQGTPSHGTPSTPAGQTYSQYYGNVDAGGGTVGPSGYTDLAINSGYLYDHPEVIAADLLQKIGITNPEVIDMLTKQTDLAYALQFILQGGAGSIPTSSEITDFVMNYVNGLLTPGGGAGYTTDQLLGDIANADPNSPLGKYLANGGADAVNNLIMSAAMSTTLPYYQSALKSQLDNAGTSYAQGVAHGNPADSYWQSLQGSALGGYLR